MHTELTDSALEALLERSIEDALAKRGQVQPAAPALELVHSVVRYSDGPLGELFTALALAQSQMGHAAKDSQNPHFKSRYADLASAIDAARGPLTSNGIAIIQMPYCRAGMAGVVTRLGHSSGQWIESELEFVPRDAGAQAVGSAITYARRYAYMAMAGVAADDDDGNAAVRPHDDNRDSNRSNHIDIGPNRMYTRGASEYVRDRKIEALRKPAAAPELSSKSGEIKRAFAEIREVMGETRYSEELQLAGVVAAPSGEPRITSIGAARELYKRLWTIANQGVA